MEYVLKIIQEFWTVWCQMAPYLLLGFSVAGALSIWMKPDFIQRHLGHGTFGPVVKTSLLGVPLPLCSCGVIPVAASLKKQGASKGATASFLLSTPQTGVDSIAVTYSLLGGFFAVFRPVAALVSGIAGGIIISLLDKDNSSTSKDFNKNDPEKSDSSVDESCQGTCCSSDDDISGNPLFRALKYGFKTLPGDIGKALILGVLIAAFIGAFAPPDFFQKLPGGSLVQMLYMMMLGIPIYVCATASVPIAAALILKGISPGAALVFLVTGPATNAAALTTIWKILGRSSALIYLFVVALFALLSGISADYLLTLSPVMEPVTLHEHGLSTWETVAGILMMIILAYAYLPKSKNDSVSMVSKNIAEEEMVLEVEGMNCSHCTNTVEDNLQKLPMVRSVSVDLGSGRVSITGRNLNRSRLSGIINELGFKCIN